jgi:hypothetical protein
MTAATLSWDGFVERVSQELYDAGIRHHIIKKPGHTLALDIGGIASFSSVRELAEALESAGADFSYSAGGGFILSRKGFAS